MAKLLKSGGSILIYEMHPFAYFFEQADLDKEITLDDFISYFEKGPYSYPDGLEYLGRIKYNSKPCYWHMHTISDILNSILKNGIEIVKMIEYNIDMTDTEQLAQFKKFPFSYILIGEKKDNGLAGKIH